ncbi:MAG: TRAP transporter small permease subunit [Alphaproteobacteria bacterium]|nr:TRAP transporter small permease subunit [Alphaproteobacteria bacterium]
MTTPPSEPHRWSRALRLAGGLERPVVWVGEGVSWLFLPLIAIILFDAVSRRYLRKLSFVIENDLHFYFNSPALQDAEWHLHTILFLGALGYAYTRNAHVRLDIFRPRFSDRGRLWVEFLGGLSLLVPFIAIFTYFSWIFFWSAWVHDEGYGESNGIGDRWFIKFFMVLGPGLLFLSGLSTLTRLFVRLFGPPELTKATRTGSFSDESYSAFN